MTAAPNRFAWPLSVSIWIAIGSFSVSSSAKPNVEFNRDVRPILSENCFKCHGPDQAHRKANLRFDTEEGAFATLDSGEHAIVRGDVSKSELARRIMSSDSDDRMPPPDSGRKLSQSQKDALVNWIKQGAHWQKHWSLIPPKRASLPRVKDSSWPRVPWDAFVLSRLEQEGQEPSPEADKETLLRRVTLDLTGLPPSLEEIDDFTNDKTRGAYEKVVDRLLASPRYGERMATEWLDAARYADTNGYQADGVRYMWRWRDWVIDALNNNMPFDQFTIEQLAGDMLSGATLEQKIATGFNRNHRGNAEGGIIPEEFAAEYVVDRVETTSTVWLGLTLGCARCHDHKFDPFSQKEFYQLFALFNNVPERGRAVKFGNSDPQIKAPTPAQSAELQRLSERLASLHTQLDDAKPQIAQAQAEWEKSAPAKSPEDWAPSNGLILYLPLDGDTSNRCATSHAKDKRQGTTTFSQGQIGSAATFTGSNIVDLGDVANFGFFDSFSISCWIRPERADGVLVGRMIKSGEAGGYDIELSHGKLQLNLVVRWLDDALRVETSEPLAAGWHHVAVTYDGSRVASGIKMYVDGQPARLHVLIDELNQNFARKGQPLLIGGCENRPKYAGQLDELRIYDRVLSPDETELLATPATIDTIAALPTAERTPAQSRKLTTCFLDKYAPDALAKLRAQVIALERKKLALEKGVTTSMVMQEMPTPRATFVLKRGQYDQPGERVAPGVPASLSWPGQLPVRDRLDFARWLVAPENPLTARVTVNRIWQLYFGIGLVKTVNDFGSQGEPPSHPALLDYLATEFASSGWNLKALHKSIVMSATYRQSSRMTPKLLERDPDNRLLSRGPRVRLPAEMIRDQALFASGLLVEKIGGPSVMPYQPPGLWTDLSAAEYHQDHGESLYRRSLYTFWKRTAAPPTMITFDASGRETCRVLQTRTNTPLQALAMMNEITFVEAARKLAERAFHEAGNSPEQRLERVFRQVLGRFPASKELEILKSDQEHHLDYFRKHPAAAQRLLDVGESPRDEQIDPVELAALSATSNLVLNLDEAITKQ